MLTDIHEHLYVHDKIIGLYNFRAQGTTCVLLRVFNSNYNILVVLSRLLSPITLVLPLIGLK